jgi:ankyrin repeat protein
MLSDVDAGILEAVEADHLDRTRELLAAGANPNILQVHGARLLDCAANTGDPQMVEMLLRSGAHIDGKHYFYGYTALHSVARTGDLPIMQLLVEKGANINATDHRGNTAMCNSVTYLRPGVAPATAFLLEAGADVNVPSGAPHSPLELAVGYRNDALIDTLLEAGAEVRNAPNGGTALTIASMRRADTYVRTLVRAGADVNAMTGDGWTALTLQAERGSHGTTEPCPSIIVQLVAAGARLDLECGASMAEMHAASMRGANIRPPVVPDADRSS